jgi:hypothetical protein
MTDTVREQIVKFIVDLLENIDKGDPTNDPWNVQFTEVYRDPPEALTVGRAMVAVVLDGSEVKTPLNYPVVDVVMPIDVEVHVLRDKDVSAGEIVNRCMGCVEQQLRADFTCGGLCVDLLVTGTEKTPTEGPYENYVSGIVRFQVNFRHHADDPRSKI